MYNLPMRKIRNIFLRHGKKVIYNKNQFLFMKGSPVDRIGFIDSGQFRTIIMNSEGDEMTIFYLDSGELIGLDSLSTNYTVRVMVQATTKSEVYMIPSAQFLKIWMENGLSIQDLLEYYVERLALLSEYICCSHFTNATKKVAYFLYFNSKLSGPVVSLSNEQIAAVTGINRISVNRILNSLAEKGILRLDYKKIVILDETGLTDVFNNLGYSLD